MIPRQYDRNLDVLRAVAVLLVLATHALNYALAPVEAQPVLQLLGNLGVAIFFVHTSLVLMRSLERTQLRGLKAWALVRDFYVRRAFRIYPLAVITVLAVIVFHLYREPSDAGFTTPSTREVVANLTLTQNLWGLRSVLAPLWSLPLEMEMYVVLPVLMFLVSRVESNRILLLLFGVSVLSAIIYAQGTTEIRGLWRLSLFNYLPCFVAGVLAYRACRLTRPSLPSYVWPLVISSSLVAISFTHPAMDLGFWRAWLVASILAVFIPLVRELPPSRATGVSHLIAKYSYGVYLSHVPMLDVAVRIMRDYPLWLRISVGVGGIAMLPVLLYVGIEQPMIRLGAVYATSLSHGRVTAETAASATPVP